MLHTDLVGRRCGLFQSHPVIYQWRTAHIVSPISMRPFNCVWCALFHMNDGWKLKNRIRMWSFFLLCFCSTTIACLRRHFALSKTVQNKKKEKHNRKIAKQNNSTFVLFDSRSFAAANRREQSNKRNQRLNVAPFAFG